MQSFLIYHVVIYDLYNSMEKNHEKKTLAKCIGAGFILTSSFAFSQSIPVLNHEYEFDTIPHDTQKTTSISGWVNSGVGGIGVEIPLGGGLVYNGFENLSQAAYLNDRGRLRQSLGTELKLGKVYTLSYLVGWPLAEENHRIQARITSDGLILAEYETNSQSLSQGDWKRVSFSFTPSTNMPIGRPLTIEFINPPTDTPDKAHLDDIVFEVADSTTTQEPFTPEVIVLNHKFDHDLIPIESSSLDSITAWQNTGNGPSGVELTQGSGVDYNDNVGFEQVAFLEEGGRISQALDITVEKGESYTLNYNVGRPLGTSGHSVIARVKSQGLVLAQKHTQAEHLEPGQRIAQNLTFTATETMPLGNKVAIEFYNPPTTAGSKVHINNVQMQIAGTGEVFTPPIAETPPMDIIGDVVQNDLTIHIPEDFDDLNLALDFLDNKIIQNDKQVTLQVNNCGATYDEPVVITHPQGSQLNIQGVTENCRLNFTGKNGFVVSTALNKLSSFYLYGPNVVNGPTGLLVEDGATVGESNNVGYFNFEDGIKSTQKSHIKALNNFANNNKNNGLISILGGFIELNHTYLNSNLSGNLSQSNGVAYIYNGLHANNNIGVTDNAYAYFLSSVYTNTSRLIYSTTFSTMGLAGTFPSPQGYDFFSSRSSWINLQHSPQRRVFNASNGSYINFH